MDAAEELTGTYLQRVPRRYACKRPQQTEALAQNLQTKHQRKNRKKLGHRSRITNPLPTPNTQQQTRTITKQKTPAHP
jgi:hypothetical protein